MAEENHGMKNKVKRKISAAVDPPLFFLKLQVSSYTLINGR
jgi:hypothetical protein